MYPIIDEDRIRELKIRKFIVGKYIVFYIIEENKIQITRILHAKRNWIDLI
jgi:plasmid stabilization system protein ParE